MEADKAEGFALLMTAAKMLNFSSLLSANPKCNVHTAAINLSLASLQSACSWSESLDFNTTIQRIQKYIKRL